MRWLVLLLVLATNAALAQCNEELLLLSDSSVLSTYYWEEDADSVLHLREFDTPQIIDGDSMVFTYICQTENFQETIRYGIGSQLTVKFQVPMSEDNFLFDGKDMIDAKPMVDIRCQCPDVVRNYLYDEGFLSGKRLNKYEWQLAGEIPFLEGKSKKKQRIVLSGLFPIVQANKK